MKDKFGGGQQSQWVIEVVLVGIVIALALTLRFSLGNYESFDFTLYTHGWYTALKEQGVAAMSSDLANYTPPYLYLLYVVGRIFPELPDVIAIKIPSIAFDLICAGIVFQIVRLKYPKGPYSIYALCAVLLAPTVIINSALWGQSDSIYTAMLLTSVYFLLRGRGVWASLAFGAAFAFKLQAIFLLPLLVALALKDKLKWKHLALFLVIYLAAIVPAWIAGRPLLDLLTIYLKQSQMYSELSLGAPNVYAWLPQQMYSQFLIAGLYLATSLSILFILIILKSETALDGLMILRLSLISLILLPYFLPKMHERYFYPAEVLSIAYGFYFPKHYFIPIGLGLIGFFTSESFLFKQDIIPIPLLALGMLTILVILVREVWLDLYPKNEILVSEQD
jgi:Gpi18-like mannosyltransferase